MDTTSHPYTAYCIDLSNVAASEGDSSLALAQDEAHYHRITGHEAAEADFSCGRIILTNLLSQVTLLT